LQAVPEDAAYENPYNRTNWATRDTPEDASYHGPGKGVIVAGWR
jgi:hypothetical protein